MKYRKDFVTNSSSSSYIFAIHNEKVNPAVAKIMERILNHEDFGDCGNPSINITADYKKMDLSDTINFLINECIEEGYDIYKKEFGYDEEYLLELAKYICDEFSYIKHLGCSD